FLFTTPLPSLIYTLSLHDALPILGLVELVSEPLAGLELGLLRGGDLDLLAGARIAAFRSGATGHRKGPEANKTNLATPLQCAGEDRKSRRLNSSHRTISYAVFCLK